MMDGETEERELSIIRHKPQEAVDLRKTTSEKADGDERGTYPSRLGRVKRRLLSEREPGDRCR